MQKIITTHGQIYDGDNLNFKTNNWQFNWFRNLRDINQAGTDKSSYPNMLNEYVKDGQLSDDLKNVIFQNENYPTGVTNTY